MSLMSTRSMALAVSVAVCGLAVAVRPVRSWALNRSAAANAEQRRSPTGSPRPVTPQGMYPDVDIQFIDDYSSGARSPKRSIIRIHMDIDVEPGSDFKDVKQALSATPYDIEAVIKAINDLKPQQTIPTGKPPANAKRGLKVLNAAIGRY